MKPFYRISLSMLLAGLCSQVMAHDGPLAHAGFHNNMLAGFMHPLTGIDHLSAMLLAGAMLANTTRRQMAGYGMAMLLALLCGTAMGVALGNFAIIETIVMASCFVIAAALVKKHLYSINANIACALLGSLFVAHGWAHGAELPVENITQFISGFMLAAVVLLATGMLMMQALLRCKPTPGRA